MAAIKSKTWNKTRVQDLLRHRGGAFYARLYVAGKEKWLSLETTLLEVAKAKLDQEKALAEARTTEWPNGKDRSHCQSAKVANKRNMASIHHDPRSQFWCCAYTDSDGKRVFKSPGKPIRLERGGYCIGIAGFYGRSNHKRAVSISPRGRILGPPLFEVGRRRLKPMSKRAF